MGNINIIEEGIVIKESVIKESDKVITILLNNIGKIVALARGAKKMTSSIFPGTQLFCYSKFVLYEKNGFYYVVKADIIQNFSSNDYVVFCYQNYFCEMVNKTIMGDGNCNEIFGVLVKCLKKIRQTPQNVSYIARIFELKFLELNGYKPQLYFCNGCRKKIYDSADEKIFINENGVLCNDCRKQNYIVISKDAFDIIKIIFEINSEDVFDLLPNVRILNDIIRFSRMLIHYHLDVSLNTSKFIIELESGF